VKNLWVIFKKEIYRVVTDKRLVLGVFILPGLSIFLIYTIIGTAIGGQMDEEQAHVPTLYVENLPGEVEAHLDAHMDYTLQEGTIEEEALREKIREEELDLAVIFPEDFAERIDSREGIPEATVFYNQGSNHSSNAYNNFNQAMGAYHENIIMDRLDDPSDYHPYELGTVNLVDERNVVAQGFAMLMPMLIIIFLFVGVMNIGPDAIAGEKERGTIATLLVTPTRRTEIALGKVLSIALLSFASALSSFIGILLSLPQLMQFDDTLPDISIYGIGDFAVLLLVLIITVFFIVALVSIISTYAKSVKEATTLIMPFYFIAMIIGIMNSFGTDVNQSLLPHLAPIYGPINLLAGILTFEYSLVNFFATVLSTLVYTSLFVVLLNRMFSDERIMFTR